MKLSSPQFRLLSFFLLLLVFLLAWLYFPVKPKGQVPDLSEPDSLFLFAHRGVCVRFTENSLPAFRSADSLGFPGLEMDIRMTADSELIIFHDPDGGRLLGKDLLIASVSLDSIQQHKLLAAAGEPSGKVITLREYFSHFNDRFLVYLDVKPLEGPVKYEEARQLLRILEMHHALPYTLVANYDIRFLIYLKINNHEVKTVLEGFNAGKEWIWPLIPRRWKPDYLSSFSSRVNREQREWLERRELLGRRIVYEVDSANFESIHRLGIPGMIIDYFPGLNPWLEKEWGKEQQQ